VPFHSASFLAPVFSGFAGGVGPGLVPSCLFCRFAPCSVCLFVLAFPFPSGLVLSSWAFPVPPGPPLARLQGPLPAPALPLRFLLSACPLLPFFPPLPFRSFFFRVYFPFLRPIRIFLASGLWSRLLLPVSRSLPPLGSFSRLPRLAFGMSICFSFSWRRPARLRRFFGVWPLPAAPFFSGLVLLGGCTSPSPVPILVLCCFCAPSPALPSVAPPPVGVALCPCLFPPYFLWLSLSPPGGGPQRASSFPCLFRGLTSPCTSVLFSCPSFFSVVRFSPPAGPVGSWFSFHFFFRPAFCTCLFAVLPPPLLSTFASCSVCCALPTSLAIAPLPAGFVPLLRLLALVVLGLGSGAFHAGFPPCACPAAGIGGCFFGLLPRRPPPGPCLAACAGGRSGARGPCGPGSGSLSGFPLPLGWRLPLAAWVHLPWTLRSCPLRPFRYFPVRPPLPPFLLQRFPAVSVLAFLLPFFAPPPLSSACCALPLPPLLVRRSLAGDPPCRAFPLGRSRFIDLSPLLFFPANSG